ncbi:heme-binding protein [Rhizobium leguminosarum]|uniref:heme-binding protein n=1 Tax=Rhizobium leguminosarum TaxID=384 RepID=UPI001C95F859|nr:heme-binding protein [Rhizobium leguminosarum]MBY5637830.1 heme-binding protein [Rhizobium leguminosarum]MBY5728686.1 heme-binding protein [Rhizobium leguminosarum]
MDGATAQILTFAENKAFTASTIKRTTVSYFDRMDQNASLRFGLANRDRLLVWRGGLPIKFEAVAVNGIGVSRTAPPPLLSSPV